MLSSLTIRLLPVVITAAGAVAAPASAQFYYQTPDFSGARVTGDEPGITTPLPDATPNEIRASLVWNLRAGLNVAALACQFEPTLLTRSSYNAVISNHAVELKNSFDALSNYFRRTNKTVAAGQQALDQFGTRTYSSFSTVGAQYNFCETAGSVMREALFAPRGEFNQVAQRRMRELRNSLTAAGEQRFHFRVPPVRVQLPSLEDRCWHKKRNTYRDRCGPLAYGILGLS